MVKGRECPKCGADTEPVPAKDRGELAAMIGDRILAPLVHAPDVTDYAVVQAMRVYGGSFASAVAAAFDHADADNTLRLKVAFPEMWDEYTELARRRRDAGKGPK